jgi:hypothetical protein
MMIKTKKYLNSFVLLFLFIGFFSIHASAQTVNHSMEIQPELSVEVLQNLNFGTVITNSGIQQIPLGDNRMGVFEIRALATQSVLISLEKPDYLTAAQNGNSDQIPLSLQAAYSSRPKNYDQVIPFDDNLRTVLESIDNLENSSTWETGYVYIFGDIDVGDIIPDSYSSTLVLNVVYQ